MLLPLGIATLFASLSTGDSLSVNHRSGEERVRAYGGFGRASAVVEKLMDDVLGDEWWSLFEGDPRELAEDFSVKTGFDPGDLVFELAWLEVEPRGTGLGRRLLESLEERVVARGAKGILLQSAQVVRGAPHSLGFWRAMGYKVALADLFEDRGEDRILYKVFP